MSQARQPNGDSLKRRAIPEGGEELRSGSGVQTIDREQFSAGLFVRVVRTDEVTDKKTGKGYKIHVFSGKQGKEFGLWGSADIDHRISVSQKGDILYIAFEGIQPHPTNAAKGQTLAVYTVARMPASAADKLVDESTLPLAEDGDLPF